MRGWLGRTAGLALIGAALGWAASAAGQQVRGMPGAPNVVVMPQGLQLPAPSPPFSGQILPNAIDSTPAWPPKVMRAIYQERWMASTTPVVPPRDTPSPKPSDELNGYAWDLHPAALCLALRNEDTRREPDVGARWTACRRALP